MSTPVERVPSDVELAEIQARADAATPGPWELTESGVILGPPHAAHGLQSWVTSLVDLIHQDDAAFIVAARTDVPRLVEAVRVLSTSLHEVDEARRFAEDETARLQGQVERVRALAEGRAEFKPFTPGRMTTPVVHLSHLVAALAAGSVTE